MSERQEVLDRFYHSHGPCCAGCDWWRSLNAVAGECTRKAPTGARKDRIALLRMSNSSLSTGSGHVLTPRTHVCGEFKDEFDWSLLPPAYLRRIGAMQWSRQPKRPSPPGETPC